MSAFLPSALARPPSPAARPIAGSAGLVLAGAVGCLVGRIAPEAPAFIAAALAGAAGLGVLALAWTLEDAALAKLTLAALAGASLTLWGATLDPEARLQLFGFAMLAFGGGLAAWLVRTATKRPRISAAAGALFAGSVVVALRLCVRDRRHCRAI